jgi:hypothetical protein
MWQWAVWGLGGIGGVRGCRGWLIGVRNLVTVKIYMHIVDILSQPDPVKLNVSSAARYFLN